MVSFLPTVLDHAERLQIGQRVVEQGHDNAIITFRAFGALKDPVESLPQVVDVYQGTGFEVELI